MGVIAFDGVQKEQLFLYGLQLVGIWIEADVVYALSSNHYWRAIFPIVGCDIYPCVAVVWALFDGLSNGIDLAEYSGPQLVCAISVG